MKRDPRRRNNLASCPVETRAHNNTNSAFTTPKARASPNSGKLFLIRSLFVVVLLSACFHVKRLSKSLFLMPTKHYAQFFICAFMHYASDRCFYPKRQSIQGVHLINSCLLRELMPFYSRHALLFELQECKIFMQEMLNNNSNKYNLH